MPYLRFPVLWMLDVCENASMTDGPRQRRSITSAMLIAQFAVERGVAVAEVLRGTGIARDELDDPTAEITRAQEIGLLENVVAALGDEPGFGLFAGIRSHLANHGVWGFAIINSPTVRSAVEVFVQYNDLSFSVARFRAHDEGAEIWLVRDDSAVPERIRRFALEWDLATFATMQRDFFLTPIPVRVEVAIAAHPMYEMFNLLNGVAEVSFSAPRTILKFAPGALDLPLPQANSLSAAYYEKKCMELLQLRRSRHGVSGQVRQLLIHRSGVASQPEIADELNLSVRTLRRRLAQEGTTFRELSDETSALLAEQLLAAGLTAEQTSTRLGYSSGSAFAAAFRSWKGQTPHQYARDARAAPR